MAHHVHAGAKENELDNVLVRGWSAKVVKEGNYKHPTDEDHPALDRLKFMNISPSGLATLAEELAKEDSNVAKVDLRYNFLNPGDAMVLGKGLASNVGVIVLDLRHNDLGDRGVKYLVSGLLSQDGLEELNLDGNRVGDGGAESIAELVKVKYLLWLHLRSNRIGEVGARFLAEGLKMSNTMSTLLLGLNDVQDNGIAALAEALSIKSGLKTLDLGSNMITDVGLEKICEVIKDDSLSVLRKLTLRINQITNDGFAVLAEAMTTNTHVKELDLAGNIIRDESLEPLKSLLGMNCTLTKLDLEDNCIGTDVALELLRVLDRNHDTHITNFNLSNNHLDDATLDKINLWVRTHKAELKKKEEAAKSHHRKSLHHHHHGHGHGRKSVAHGRKSVSHSRGGSKSHHSRETTKSAH